MQCRDKQELCAICSYTVQYSTIQYRSCPVAPKVFIVLDSRFGARPNRFQLLPRISGQRSAPKSKSIHYGGGEEGFSGILNPFPVRWQSKNSFFGDRLITNFPQYYTDHVRSFGVRIHVHGTDTDPNQPKFALQVSPITLQYWGEIYTYSYSTSYFSCPWYSWFFNHTSLSSCHDSHPRQQHPVHGSTSRYLSIWWRLLRGKYDFTVPSISVAIIMPFCLSASGCW